MENINADDFERSLQEAFRDAELEPSSSLWENIATSSHLESNSFEGSIKNIFSEAQAKPSDDVWNQIAQSPELHGSLAHQFGAIFQDATLKPSPGVWANIEKQLHQKRFPKRVLWRIGGVAASLLLASGIWWYHAPNQGVISKNKHQNPFGKHEKQGHLGEQNTALFEKKFTENYDLNPDSESKSFSEQHRIIQKNTDNLALNPEEQKTNFLDANVLENVPKNKILATSGFQKTEKQAKTIHFDTPENISATDKSVQKVEWLTPIKMLEAGLMLAETERGEPVVVLFEIPNLSSWDDQKSTRKLTPFIGVSASLQRFTPNFKGKETAISQAIQTGSHPFTKGINSYDDDVHFALQDSILNVQSVRYGLDFGLEIENIFKKGSLSIVSGAYLTQTEFAVRSSFVRETVKQAVGDVEKIWIENTLQNRMQLMSLPIQVVYTSGGRSDLGFRIGAGIETDFVLQSEWTNPSQELAYHLGEAGTSVSYVLGGGAVYRIGKFVELGVDLTRKKSINSMYQSEYISAKPLNVGYGGHLRIKF